MWLYTGIESEACVEACGYTHVGRESEASCEGMWLYTGIEPEALCEGMWLCTCIESEALC